MFFMVKKIFFQQEEEEEMCGCQRVMVRLMRLDIRPPQLVHPLSTRRANNVKNFSKNRIRRLTEKKK